MLKALATCGLLCLAVASGLDHVRPPRNRHHALQILEVEGKGLVQPAAAAAAEPPPREQLPDGGWKGSLLSDASAPKLSNVSLTARLGFQASGCQTVLSKVGRILHFNAQQLLSAGVSKDTDVNSIQAAHAALDMLRRGNATEDSLESLLTGLGDVSLRTSLQMGDVWTSSDQNDLFHFCFPGLAPFRQLEERSSKRDLEDEAFQEVALANSYNSTEGSASTVFKVMDVHYCYRSDTLPSVRRAFVAARRQVQDQVPCINFIAVKASEEDENLCSVMPAIQVRAENTGCWSSYHKSVGTETWLGAAHLNAGRGCAMKGMILYQLSKILGLSKEANRADRDLHLNFRLDNVRKEVSAKKIFEKRTLPPSEAYANGDDFFDLLSISMPSSKAYTDGKSNALEPISEPLLARFMGQRMGLSELDVAALADKYRCFDRTKPENPTRVLAGKFLQGDGLVFDGSCRDVQPSRNLTQFLSLADSTDAGEMQVVDCKAFGASLCQKAAALAKDSNFENVQPMCTLSCLNCIPADEELVSQMNQRVVHQDPGKDGYCDDQGCQSADPQGAFCKFKNPDAKRVPCVRAGIKLGGQGYCDDHGCESPDPSGAECRKMNQNAVQIPCAVLSRSNSTPNSTNQLKVSPSGCADLAITGIRFRSGPQATCHDLRAYCGNNALSDRVLKVCPATCEQEGYACANTLSYQALPKVPEPIQMNKGQSKATTNVSNVSQDVSPSPAPTTTTSRDVTLPPQGCVDLAAHDKPVLTVHGVNRTCREVSSYCFNTANSVAVRAKCPVSCGECVPEEVEEATTTTTMETTTTQRDTNPAVVNKETVTTAPQEEGDDYWHRTLPPLTPDYTAMGCDRRRRFGFCSSRRRDNPSVIPSTTPP
eukprot:TRINITY_DN59278_c0_g1_i1.p1 TRINITY_DN59278_c0_g1~~TRINITY_DN59278_c0_g1_i1.p1  ORF type:complete len:879 (-),score=167.41 TRINITY_DN59278_c0_g1_i1:64-2700(-)